MWINNTRMYCSSLLAQSLARSLAVVLCCEHWFSGMLIFPVHGVPARIVTSYLIYFCHFFVMCFSCFVLFVCISLYLCVCISTSVSIQFPYNKTHGIFQCVHIFNRTHHNYLFIEDLCGKDTACNQIKTALWNLSANWSSAQTKCSMLNAHEQCSCWCCFALVWYGLLLII